MDTADRVESFEANQNSGGSLGKGGAEDMTEYSREWEEVNEDTERLRHPDGWSMCRSRFAKSQATPPGALKPITTGVSMTMTCWFVPDPEHKWILEDK